MEQRNEAGGVRFFFSPRPAQPHRLPVHKVEVQEEEQWHARRAAGGRRPGPPRGGLAPWGSAMAAAVLQLPQPPQEDDLAATFCADGETKRGWLAAVSLRKEIEGLLLPHRPGG